jgi:ATP-dependent Clp protease ATP-binding subunit ClpC
MGHRILRLLLALYPSWWRQRYGGEADAILDQSEPSLRSFIDLLRGAVDAWTSQRPPHELFARFGVEARTVVALAQKEARTLHHDYLGTEHILLGLFADSAGAAAQTLNAFGVAPEIVRTRLLQIVGQGWESMPARCARASAPSDRSQRGMRLTGRTKRGFECSAAAADRLGDPSIDDTHLLLGLLDEGEGVGALILAEFVEPDRIRRHLALLRP